MEYCSLCGDDSVLTLLRAQWALILGEGLGRKGERWHLSPLPPCSASKPAQSKKDGNSPFRTAGVPERQAH